MRFLFLTLWRAVRVLQPLAPRAQALPGFSLSPSQACGEPAIYPLQELPPGAKAPPKEPAPDFVLKPI